ncbi:unnamed protein product [marine sediment metagenome]|uniref:Uncharacterized protein n=1 Tax=marine sediment metagenome TaxID=412755 RepID=X0YQH7_9ZZZZ
MRNKSEAAPVRPVRMSQEGITRVLGSICAGDIFRVWYLQHESFTEKVEDGKDVLWFGDIVLDEGDADAVRSGIPVEFEMVSPPGRAGSELAVLMRNGKESTFVYDHQGIHHIEILS